jgi:hypothetical protein
MKKLAILITLLIVSFNGVASDLSNRGEYAWSPDRVTVNAKPPLSDLLREQSEVPIFSIEAASVSAPDKLNALNFWNLLNTPLKNGFSHVFPSEANVEISAPGSSLESLGESKGHPQYGQIMYTPDGDLLWSASVEVHNSHRLRLNLSNVDLPEGARLWVYGAGDEVVGPFGKELAAPSGDIWTPSVSGPQIMLVVMLPEGSPSARFSITRVLELFRLNASGAPVLFPQEDRPPDDLSCLVESLCVNLDTFPRIEDVENAIGRMDFIIDGEGSLCTGGLINDAVGNTTIPYFLSANHCFSTQEVASTLEVYWDWKPDGCNGTDPDLASLPRSNGATLKATGVPADFLLLELNAIPEGRYMLGYTLEESAIAAGEKLHRVSHPAGKVQHYSQTTVVSGSNYCGDTNYWNDTTHIWQSFVIGSTLGGSSGSPVVTASAEIVGQHSGTCPLDNGNGEWGTCETEPTIDGKLSNYWAEVSQFLDPENTQGKSDMSLTVLDAADGSYAPGDNLKVTVEMANVGAEASGVIQLRLYASADTLITSDDILIEARQWDAIAAGSSGPVPWD